MNVSDASVVAIMLAVLLLGTVTPGVAAVERTEDGVRAQQTTPETPTTETSNASVRHANPDEAESEETLSELRGQLAQRLSGRLTESSVRISEGQYERARSLLGEEYIDTLGKYADVAREQGDEGAATAFERTGRTQRNFSETVAEYQETEQAYREAKQAGNESEARRLARELDAIAADVERQSSELNRSYVRLENETETDFGEARERIVSVQEEISESQAEIRRAELRATTLSVQATDRRVSFADPLAIEGQLTDSIGSPIDNRSVAIHVGERHYTVQTDGEGSFSLAYRPVRLPLNASTVEVRYAPQSTAAYVASNQSVPVTVDQVNATVEFGSVPERASYGDPVNVTGRVVADNRSVPNLSASVEIDNRSIGVNRTGGAGRFAVGAPLPADVVDGEHPVRVTGPSDRAVAVAATSEPVRVVSTPTNVTLSLAGDGTAVAGSGRLTAAGDGVGGRQLTLFVGDAAVERTTTAADGTYRVEIDREAIRDGATVRVRFDGSETNLESATASAAFSAGESAGDGDGAVFETGDGLFGLGGDGGSGGASESGGDAPGAGPAGDAPGTPSQQITLSAAITVIVLAAGWYAIRRWRSRDETNAPAAEPDDGAEQEDVETGPSPLELLASGEAQGAILAAYRSVQRSLTPALDDTETVMTHRRFYAACQRAGIVPMEYLREINDAYETAVYSDRELSSEQARDAIVAARHLVETDDGEPDS